MGGRGTLKIGGWGATPPRDLPPNPGESSPFMLENSQHVLNVKLEHKLPGGGHLPPPPNGPPLRGRAEWESREWVRPTPAPSHFQAFPCAMPLLQGLSTPQVGILPVGSLEVGSRQTPRILKKFWRTLALI